MLAVVMAWKCGDSRRAFLAATLGTVPLRGQSWTAISNEKNLGDWTVTPFPGHGAVVMEGGAIRLPAGRPSTGITYRGVFPRLNYAIRYEAVRREGSDFFACLTFPAGEAHATFVNGGWGGDIVGISSIDGWDASENETRSYFTFEPNRWYAFELTVMADWIKATIDGQSIFRVETGGRVLSLYRDDTKLSTPLGFSSYNTTGEVRKIEYRMLKPGRGSA